MFIEDAADDIGFQFFEDFWNKPLPTATVDSRPNNPLPAKNQAKFKEPTLNDLVFQALGSSKNREEFVICEKSINSVKENVWSGADPMEEGRFKKYAGDAAKGILNKDTFLSPLRTVSLHTPRNCTTTNSSRRLRSTSISTTPRLKRD